MLCHYVAQYLCCVNTIYRFNSFFTSIEMWLYTSCYYRTFQSFLYVKSGFTDQSINGFNSQKQILRPRGFLSSNFYEILQILWVVFSKFHLDLDPHHFLFVCMCHTQLSVVCGLRQTLPSWGTNHVNDKGHTLSWAPLTFIRAADIHRAFSLRKE